MFSFRVWFVLIYIFFQRLKQRRQLRIIGLPVSAIYHMYLFRLCDVSVSVVETNERQLFVSSLVSILMNKLQSFWKLSNTYTTNDERWTQRQDDINVSFFDLWFKCLLGVVNFLRENLFYLENPVGIFRTRMFPYDQSQNGEIHNVMFWLPLFLIYQRCLANAYQHDQCIILVDFECACTKSAAWWRH